MARRIATHRRHSYCVFKRVAKKQKHNQLSMAQGFGSGSVFMVSCLCMMGVLYLFTVNSVTTQGNTIYELEQKIDELTEENEKMSLKEAELVSLDKIEKVIEEDMVAIDDPVYVDEETLMSMEN